jgi:hypothetical protein
MSEQSSNPDRKNTMSMQDSMKNNIYEYSEYELITEFIDNEISDPELREKIHLKINSDPDYFNRYNFELLTKKSFSTKSTRIETPHYLYQNIHNGIDDYIQKAGHKVNQNFIPSSEISKIAISKNSSPLRYRSNYKKYIPIYVIAFFILMGTAFFINNYIESSPDVKENDLVAIARNIFEKVEKGELKIQYSTKNADELKDSMEKNLDFNVFVPDVLDAELIGGVCNEINGQKLAHIIHKKDGIIIYTLQAEKNKVMNNNDSENHVTLNANFKTEVENGKNWFPCNKDKSKTVVIWYRGNVICSSVSEMDSQEISTALTSYRK